jgi:hypothetical protein
MPDMNRDEALRTARKMLRGFSGAPDPRKHANRLFTTLVHAHGWSETEGAAIIELGDWLQTRPDHASLRTRCSFVLAQFQ